MERNFFKFVWRYSRREQLFILALTFTSFPLVYISLEIPKIIVNDAIDGRDFPREILGLEFGQIPYLLLLCGAFLGMVVLINAVKWFMNIAIGMTGERMLRRLRHQLFQQVMRFRMRRFRSTKPGEVVQSLMGEIEPLGGFIGEVIATPAFQGGLLCVYVTFIFVQDALLGLAAISLYPLQAWLIPKLQAKVIRLNKERAANNRELADSVSESVGQIAEIHTNDTARWHMAQVSGRLYENTRIRMAIFRRKFTIKFVNNFLNQLTPFFFYSIGGYLVIKGEMDFGALVAVLAAYKDLAGPWKALLAYVQRWADFKGRYGFVVENFVGDDVAPAERIWDEAGRARGLSGPLTFDHVEGGPGTGGLAIDGIEIAPGTQVAVMGGEGAAREQLLRMCAGLTEPAMGAVRIGGQALGEATMPQIGRSIARVTAEPGVVNRPMRDNLLYGLLTRAPKPGDDPVAALMQREAAMTGDIAADPEGDWIDYDAAGVDGRDALDARLLALVERFGLAEDLHANALDTRIDPSDAERWTAPVMAARHALAETAAQASLGDIVEPWERTGFNANANLLENLLFALPVDARGDAATLAARADMVALLDKTGGTAALEQAGWAIALEFAELVETVGAASGVLDGFAGYPRADILAAAELARTHKTAGLESVGAEGRTGLVGLAARFVPRRDRLEVLEDADRARILACRARVLSLIAGRSDVVRFDEARFSPALTISENIIGAKRRFDRKAQWRQLEAAMETAIRDAGIRDELMQLGLAAPVGAGGANLSQMARRRMGLIRAVVKRPALILLDGVASGAREEDAALRVTLAGAVPDATLIWSAEGADALTGADLVLRIGPDGVVLGEQIGPRAPRHDRPRATGTGDGTPG